MMMKSWFQTTRGAVLKTKIDAEMTMLEREITTNQKAFGVEFYSLLLTKNYNEIIPLPSIFNNKDDNDDDQETNPINDVVKKYQAQMGLLVQQLEEKENHLRVMKNERQAAAPRAVTPTDKFHLATKWATDSGTAINVRLEMNAIEEKIRKCKEEFGVEVWPLVAQTTIPSSSSSSSAFTPQTQLKGFAAAASAAGDSLSRSAIGRRVSRGVKTASKRYLGSEALSGVGDVTRSSSASDFLSDEAVREKKIQECLEEAQKEIGFLEERMNKLRQERDALSAP